MKFRILGPLAVRAPDGRLVELGAAKHRVLLSVLLLHAGQTVQGTRLIEALWPDEPPRSARQLLRTYVSGLRGSLSLGGRDGPAVLVSDHGGYRLQVSPAELDMLMFQDLADQGERAVAAGDLPLAAERLHGALAVWQGRVAEDVRLDGWALLRVTGLEEQRLTAQERWLETRLALGHHAGLIADLRGLIAANPLRERLTVLLMRALYQAGRQAEALAAYADTRQILVEQLGIEPGPELRRVHHDILTQQEEADRQEPARTTRPAAQMVPLQPVPVQPVPVQAVPVQAVPSGVVPRQLPAAPHLVARAAHLNSLDDCAERDSGTRIVVISGTAGVGKTALAVYWAHRAAGLFPDGQLYIDLRGFAPDQAPVGPQEAVCEFFDAFGIPPDRMPGSLAAQLGLYRSLLAGRRVLVVLDNARDADQVRPLLPNAPGCLTVVTSRNQLFSLVATEGARLLAPDTLTAAQSRELLDSRLDPRRTAAEPDAAAEIITWCAGLPLALAIVAARASAHPTFPMVAIAAELRGMRGLPGALDTTDPRTDVRATFSWSYRQLSPGGARLFRFIGVHPAPHLTIPAAASLAGVPVPDARALIAELRRAHLVTEQVPGRYACHDLLRVYATELSRDVDGADERLAAQRRMLGHYLHTANTADGLLFPHRNAIALEPPGRGVTPEPLTVRAEASSWFNAEHAALVQAVQGAADAGFHTQAWQLAWAHADFLYCRAAWHDLAASSTAALAAARRAGSQAGQAHAHRGLAGTATSQGRHANSYWHLLQALDLLQRPEDRADQAMIHCNAGMVLQRLGRHASALVHARRAHDLCRVAADQRGQARALTAIGWSHALLGDYRQALTIGQRMLTVHQELGDLDSEADAWNHLGYIRSRLGDHQGAITCHERALALFRQTGARMYESEVLIHLGDTHHAAGDLPAARDAWQQARDLLDRLGDPQASEPREKLRALPEAGPHATAPLPTRAG